MNNSSLSKYFILLFYFLLISCTSLTLEQPNIFLKPLNDDVEIIKHTSRLSMLEIAKDIENNEFSRTVEKLEPYVVDGDTLLYVASFDKGWEILSSDQRTERVLAYSPDGCMNIYDSTNVGFQLWLDGVVSSLQNLNKTGIDTKSSNETMWAREITSTTTSTSTTEIVHPLLVTQWGQSNPWNVKTPIDEYGDVSLTGCPAVALSQLLYFYHFNFSTPSGLYHTITPTQHLDHIDVRYLYPNYYYNEYFYTQTVVREDYTPNSSRWGDMALNIGDTSRNTRYVADLMTEVGNRIGIIYNRNGSGAGFSNIYNAFQYYSLSADYSSYSYSIVQNDLINHKPVLMLGERLNGDAHAWVVDGFEENEYVRTYNYTWHIAGRDWEGDLFTTQEVKNMFPDIKPEDGMQSSESVTGQVKRLHMNWGSDGNNDGFFYATASWMGFDENRIVIYNITPTQ